MKAGLEGLIEEALRVRERAYAPYSGFFVGAAVGTAEGGVFTGCNVENLSYGLTICAERNALAAAVAGNERQIVGMAIAADSREPVSPCGACRQVMAEFGDFPVVTVTLGGDRFETSVRELLPRGETGILDR